MFTREELQGLLRKALAAAIGGLLAFVLLTALLIAGVILALRAAALGLAPWLGEAGALAVVSLGCFCLLALFFYRLTRPARRISGDKSGTADGEDRQRETPVDMLRRLIRNNPWEAAAAAFAVGFMGQADERMRTLLFEGGMAFMRQAQQDPDLARATETPAQSPVENTTPPPETGEPADRP